MPFCGWTANRTGGPLWSRADFPGSRLPIQSPLTEPQWHRGKTRESGATEACFPPTDAPQQSEEKITVRNKSPNQTCITGSLAKVVLTPIMLGCRVQPGLAIVGLDHRTAPASLVERIVGGEEQCRACRADLSASAVEMLYWSTEDRSEIVAWAADPVEVVNLVLQHYTRVLELRADEWQMFYRCLDEAAVAHLLRLAAEPAGEKVAARVQLAWEQAHRNGHGGRMLRQLAQASVDIARQSRASAMASTELRAAAHQLWASLQAEACLPVWALMRRELDAICLEEIAAFRRGCGGLITDAQEKALSIVTARISQRMGEWAQRASAREVAEDDSTRLPRPVQSA